MNPSQQPSADWGRSHQNKELAAHCARKLLDLRAHEAETQKQLAKRLEINVLMISRLE